MSHNNISIENYILFMYNEAQTISPLGQIPDLCEMRDRQTAHFNFNESIVRIVGVLSIGIAS
jgi:hypothetical protein